MNGTTHGAYMTWGAQWMERGALSTLCVIKDGLNICIANTVVDVDDDGGKNMR